MNKTIIFIFFLLGFAIHSNASEYDAVFSYDENKIEQEFSTLNKIENLLVQENLNSEEQIILANFQQQHQSIILGTDDDGNKFGDSFFKGLFLGCFGVVDSYLSSDSKKYKRSALWTGCCIHNLVLGTVLYLLNKDYWHLKPPNQ